MQHMRASKRHRPFSLTRLACRRPRRRRRSTTAGSYPTYRPILFDPPGQYEDDPPEPEASAEAVGSGLAQPGPAAASQPLALLLLPVGVPLVPLPAPAAPPPAAADDVSALGEHAWSAVSLHACTALLLGCCCCWYLRLAPCPPAAAALAASAASCCCWESCLFDGYLLLSYSCSLESCVRSCCGCEGDGGDVLLCCCSAGCRWLKP